MQTIDESLITRLEHDGNTQTYTIKNGSYLKNVFAALPSGIINKTETGMGATSLELDTRRNSIIVEPIKITASSKAHKHNAFYIGSETKFHSKKVSDLDILNYINDKNILYKKIVVVADSLRRIFDFIDKEVFKSYFLMIDEIDSFQMDSSFRGSMERCLDYYKLFDKDKRAMVSSTIIKFSDPELKNEFLTTIKYEAPTKREIKLILTSNINGVLFEFLKKELPESSEKWMVAYNSVKMCKAIIDRLVSEKIMSPSDIKILCSAGSKEKVQNYYIELNSNLLPAKLTFVTSAYFTGFDLVEKYNLISVSSIHVPYYTLSDNNFKQIAGRGRKGLFSETIIYNSRSEPVEQVDYGVEDLVHAANIEIQALKCIDLNYKKNPILKTTLDEIRSLIISRTKFDGVQFVRSDKDGVSKISYLNVDAYQERTRVRLKLYSDAMTLEKSLKEDGHFIKFEQIHSTIQILGESDNKDKMGSLSDVIQLLKSVTHKKSIRSQIDFTTLNHSQKEIIIFFEKFYQYINNAQLLDKLTIALEGRDKRKLVNLEISCKFFSLPNDNLLKRNVRFHIAIGTEYTAEDLSNRWNQIFLESNIYNSFDSPIAAVRYTNLHFNVTKRRAKNASQQPCYYIEGENPLRLTPINKTEM
ncbi:hypothetical protein [Dyadobacter sp. 3J3]|uniref:hypothetical protein n=1 Tax=Dyadobacter sp. 3J3 TaxID=2606600 RepID=UPI0013591F50|nr:hypothetical protein [Dyadobacter sp. 3J3]